MDQEDTLDFKSLRAKFQEEEHLLKQPKPPTTKPALPEKPKVVPPPHSPVHYLPAGARPSLLTSISQSLEGKATVAPRVVFRDEKKESKKPLIQVNTKGKDKGEVNVKKSKDKTTKESKVMLDGDPVDQKPKSSKEKKPPLLPEARNENTAELVPATPPPKATLPKKKGFLGFRKSSKRYSVEVPAEPILDSPSLEDPGPAPLIPAPSEFGDETPVLPPDIPTLPDSNAVVEVTPPSTIPAAPDFTPPPAFIPDIPAPKAPTPESETPLQIEAPALPVSMPTSQDEIIPNPPSFFPTSPPSDTISGPPPVASVPSPSPPASIEAVAAAVETPPPPATDSSSTPSSPKAECPISALSALSRAEDMSPGKRINPCDQRIFNALEKARRKISPPTNPAKSFSILQPVEELPPSPTHSLPELPPIDYVGKAFPPKELPPKPVNGFDHRQASPVLGGVTEEGSDHVPELLLVPPPPPKKVLPDPGSLGPAPEKPGRPPAVTLSGFIPPSFVENNEMPAPLELSEMDGTDVPKLDELQVSEWGNGVLTGPDTPDEQNLTEIYNNEMTPPEMEFNAAPAFGDEYREQIPPESPLSASQDSSLLAGLKAGVGNGVYESTDNAYEDVTASVAKKKAKNDGGKKRKGPPKNPYAEAQQEINEEKSKTGRFGKNEKKTTVEGPDEKELKKKEKQRLEKEKKELKEKQEREKKEQKEREKRENEMKKKFKITGQEDAMYQATVTLTTKGRKNDLPVNCGDSISIIRTTNCPKGKWLARDSSNNYGYIAVDHVELDIKEMMELGKKATITHQSGRNNVMEEEVTSTGSRVSNQYPLSAESFTDDSEEWTADDDEPHETADPLSPTIHTRTLSMPDIGSKDHNVIHQHSRSDIHADGTHVQARHEALQKLATFFHSPKPVEPAASSEQKTSPVFVKKEAIPLPKTHSTHAVNYDYSDILILPPPDLYADCTME